MVLNYERSEFILVNKSTATLDIRFTRLLTALRDFDQPDIQQLDTEQLKLLYEELDMLMLLTRAELLDDDSETTDC